MLDFDLLSAHTVSEIICVKCGKRFISVRPYDTLLKDLECPKCHKKGFCIETGQIFDEQF